MRTQCTPGMKLTQLGTRQPRGTGDIGRAAGRKITPGVLTYVVNILAELLAWHMSKNPWGNFTPGRPANIPRPPWLAPYTR